MNYKEMLNKTREKFESMSFNQGDTFSEMLSYWIVVISNYKGQIKTLEGTSNELKLVNYESSESFRDKCSYKHNTGQGYWIDYMSNNHKKTSDFIECYCHQQQMSEDSIRDFKLNILLND
jgi:hypothetical protein